MEDSLDSSGSPVVMVMRTSSANCYQTQKDSERLHSYSDLRLRHSFHKTTPNSVYICTASR